MELCNLSEVECVGGLQGCNNAPMVQTNDNYYEDFLVEDMGILLDDLKAGKEPALGPQSGRYTAELFGEYTPH